MPRQISPSKSKQIVASAAVTTSSNSGNLKGTANAIEFGDTTTFILDVTAHAQTIPAPSFRVYIDSSPDGGTTWYPSYSFANVSTSTDIQFLNTRAIGPGPTETATLTRVGTTVVTASANANNTVIAVDHRVRWEFTTNATATSATFALWQITMPFGTYGA